MKVEKNLTNPKIIKEIEYQTWPDHNKQFQEE